VEKKNPPNGISDDLNLRWDAQRKCADLLLPMVQRLDWGGWRKGQVVGGANQRDR